MGFLSNIFGGSENEEDIKWAVYLGLSGSLGMADGESTKDEIDHFYSHLQKHAKGITDSRWNKICDLSHNINVAEKALKMKKADKLNLVYYLINLSASDGYFHGAELAWIIAFTTTIKVDSKKILTYVNEKYNVNMDEFEVAMADWGKRAAAAKSSGIL